MLEIESIKKARTTCPRNEGKTGINYKTIVLVREKQTDLRHRIPEPKAKIVHSCQSRTSIRKLSI